MLRFVRLQLHQVDHVDDADLQLRNRFAEDSHSREGFKRRGIAAAGHDDIRLLALIVARPLPDTDTLGAVLDSLLHCQPLLSRMLGGYQHVDIVAAADAVVKAGQQAVGIRRQVQAHNVGLLVGDVIQEARILMRKAVVILLPYVG